MNSTACGSGEGVTRREYWQGDLHVATVTNAPYSASLVGVPAGTHWLTVVAFNADGLSSVSEGVLISVTPPPTLTIQASATNGVVLTWSAADWTLQKADVLTGLWVDVPGAASPYSVSTNNTRQFFRLRN